MKKCAVIGFPVIHSLSPKMHNAGYKALGVDFVYEKIEVKPDDLSCFMKRVKTGEFAGISVTVPHKEVILDFADELSPAVMEIGAANTLYFKNNKLIAENTDHTGFLDTLDFAFDNTEFIIYGAGGVARAILYALKISGAKNVHIFNRTPQKAEALANEFGFKIFDPKILGAFTDKIVAVNATSSREAIVPDEVLDCAYYVYDVNYGETELLKKAKSMNIECCDGKKMLLYQGCRQFKLFTGHEAPMEAMFNAISL